ncbi:Glucose dehydrogenase [Eumeta japonica]|uniref:Glucose dehydrogenase n=1 Tax=Eumeta variegata TaxID=151549 RepID=A0A4C1VYT4_EUMVA|nr:Glucose dehydrogenase [Eumeta japonica]
MEIMEGCLANFTAAAGCPRAFAGASGAVFAQALSAVVAAHCAAAYGDIQWPSDSSAHILNSRENLQYDYVVVGAGTAGSLLASRLSEKFPDWSILLIEAGDDPGPDSDIPSFFFANSATNIDWNYKTESDPGYCLGMADGRCCWSKGKAMGGSSSINAMIYLRGHPKDYDRWAELGNEHWNYESVSKHFDILEEVFDGGIDLIENAKNPTRNLWYDIIAKAWDEFGLSDNPNAKNEVLVGLRRIKMCINEGRRFNTAKVSLHNVKDNRNLHVMKNTIVQKVIIDKDTMTARGVQIRHTSGIVMEISAKNEIALSAGSIGTPQILMLSGIGPKVHLSANGIQTILDLPVGKNLQDHAFLPLFMQVDEKYSNSVPPETLTLLLIQYMLTRTGPFAEMNMVDLQGYIDTTNKTDYPDVQFLHLHYTKEDTYALRDVFKNIGYSEEILETLKKMNKDHDIIAILLILLHPKSRGEVLLRDANPLSLPIIKPNYFEELDDIETMRRAIEFIRKLLNTKMFQQVNVTLPKFEIEACSDHDHDGDGYWECYIRHLATTLYHPVGTATMGPAGDRGAVVDEDLLLHGVNGLRVVDAGVMPAITSGNTMAPTLMIAERAAHLIEKQWRTIVVKDEL